MKSLFVFGMMSLATVAFAAKKNVYLQPGEVKVIGGVKVSCQEDQGAINTPSPPAELPMFDCNGRTPNGMTFTSRGRGRTDGVARDNMLRQCLQLDPTSIGFPQGNHREEADRLCERTAATAVCN